MDNDDLWSCEGARLGNAFVAQRVRSGELGAAREVLEHSGETEQAWARKQVEFTEQIRRETSRQPLEMWLDPVP
jgi:hypothetical protein